MLIVALDPPPDADASKWISHRIAVLRDTVAGFKIGLPALLKLGVAEAKRVIGMYSHSDLLLVADLKLADIGFVMRLSAEIAGEIGFNAVIAHSFVGVRGALDVLAQRCHELGLKLITVVAMSHPAASEIFDPFLERFVSIAKEVGSWGVVAPATRPEIIRKVRELVGKDTKILAPGIGAQGASPGSALCAGADYEIVGRSIAHAEDPYKAALQILEEQRRRVEQCRG